MKFSSFMLYSFVFQILFKIRMKENHLHTDKALPCVSPKAVETDEGGGDKSTPKFQTDAVHYHS